MVHGSEGGGPLDWTPEARDRLGRVPEGVSRHLTRQRVERLAHMRGLSTVTVDLLDAKYEQWAGGSERASADMAWTEEARGRAQRIPEFVRGVVVEAIEAYARSQGHTEVTAATMAEAQRSWGESGDFHHPRG
jgi:hypothetical protein